MAHHILIVEGDDELRQLHTFQMEENGYRVTPLTRGDEILDTINRYPTDLIVLDVALPDGDGLTRLMEIRKQSDIPIIVLSEREGDDDRLMALGIGADDFIAETCKPRELILRVRNVLARSAHGVAPTETRTHKDKRTEKRPGDHERRHRRESWPPLRATSDIIKSSPTGIIVTFVAIVGLAGLSYWYANLTPSSTAIPVTSTTASVSPSSTAGPVTIPDKKAAPESTATTKTVTTPPPESKKATTVRKTTVQKAAVPPAVDKPIDWIYTARCGRMPKVAWWEYNSYEAMANYVNKRYDGNWDDYVKIWKKRQVAMENIYIRKSTAIAPSGVRLKGVALGNYVEQLRTRVKIIQCLAKTVAETN